jgi:hypothetical protein
VVPVDATLDALKGRFDEHPFLGTPVVENGGRLVGVESRAERSETESLRRKGVGGDELRSMPLMLRSRRRLAWLSGRPKPRGGVHAAPDLRPDAGLRRVAAVRPGGTPAPRR